MKNPDKNTSSAVRTAEKHFPEVVTIRDRMKSSPDHSFLHFLYVLLFIGASGCALWQHGDVRLTAGLMCAAPFMYLILFIPYRFFPSLWRGVLNGLYFAGIILWGIHRLRSVLPDLMLVECLAASCMVFLSGGSRKDRGYLFFISIFLVIYGGLIPRTAYLYFGAATLILLCLILFLQRSSSLAGGNCFREKKIRFLPRILPCVVLIAGTVFVFRYIFALMPLKNNEVPGYFQTSFLTERDNALPPELQKWFQFRKVQKVKEAPPHKEAQILADLKTAQTPVVPDPKGKPAKNVPLPPEESSLIDGNGSGASPPGRDLLFYVKSPVLLYHQVRLYDAYDGKTWRESASLKRLRSHSDSVSGITVEQKYTVLKMNSLQLCSGFELVEIFALMEEGPAIPARIFRRTPYRAFLKETPALPFKYSTNVRILNRPLETVLQNARAEFEESGETEEQKPRSGRNKKDRFWSENLPKSLYLRLPRKKISSRVRALAKEITKECGTPYEKAIALRDHLRNNYPYTLEESVKVPAGKEGSDYFLFELKKGHCEYFACALAVLGRCAGLPTRVVTGYSPGNYNTLTQTFEVHEYHAHAWTQVYIENTGWLTLDATPPSALDTEVLPRGLGHLRDPFGDEWKITPPELTRSNHSAFREAFLKVLSKQEKKVPVIDQALLQAVKTQEKVEQSVRKKYEKTVKQVQKSNRNKEGKLYKLRTFFRESVQKAVRAFYAGCDFVYSMWLLLLTGSMLLIVLYKFMRMLFFEIRRKSRFQRVTALEEEGSACLKSDPQKAVLCFYRAFRLLLLCTGRDRAENQELLELSDDLGRISTLLGENSRILFLLFYKAEYGTSSMTEEEARMAQRSFEEGKKKLLELFYGKSGS